MGTRDDDVALLRRVGVWPKDGNEEYGRDEGTLLVAGPPQEPLGRLQWSGWDTIHADGEAATLAVESIAAAIHSPRRLRFAYLAGRQSVAAVSAVEAVLQTYPIEGLSMSISGWMEEEAARQALVPVVQAWLARPCAATLEWDVRGGGWEEDIARALGGNEKLRELRLELYGEEMNLVPLLQALQGHASLTEVDIRAYGARDDEEGLCIRLADMPSLRSLSLCGLHWGGTGSASLKVECLPALQYLSLENCGLVRLPDSLAALPRLEELRVGGNPLVYPPARLCGRGWRAVQAYLAMGEAGGRGPLQRPRVQVVGGGGGGKTTLLAALHALQALDHTDAPPGARTHALLQHWRRHLEELLWPSLQEEERTGMLEQWVHEHTQEDRLGSGDALVAAVEAAGGRHMPLLEARCLAAAAWAAHGGSDEDFWTALLNQGHHVSLAVEQRPLSLGPDGPLVQAVDFAGQPEYFCCHPEFFATYGAIYVVVCPLVAAGDGGHGDVAANAQWDRSAVAYRHRLRPWLALLHSSPVGQYHALQRKGGLPPNTLVVTSFADKARDVGLGWRGAVEDVVKQSWRTSEMRQAPLANHGHPLLVDYQEDDEVEEVVEHLLQLRNALAECCRAVVEKAEHPRAFIQLRSKIFQASQGKGDFGHVWPVEGLKTYCLTNDEWISCADTPGMSLTGAIDAGLEFLESTGDVKMLTVDGEVLVLIDPIEALSKLLCRFVPGRDGCKCRHCRQQEEALALEDPSLPGWLSRSVVEDLLKKDMDRLGIGLGSRGPMAVVEAMKAFGLCYETSRLPRRADTLKPPGMRHCSEPQQMMSTEEGHFLAFPVRMGRPRAGQCFGSAVASARLQGSLAVCLCLSFQRTELYTFPTSVLSRLQCWLASQEQAVTDAAAYMCSCRGLAHLAAGGGTSVYVELAENDPQALFVGCFGPSAMMTATALVSVAKEDLNGVAQIESLCPQCIAALGEKEGVLACGTCAILEHGGRNSGSISIKYWNSKCIAGHDVIRKPSIAFVVTHVEGTQIFDDRGGVWAAEELNRRIEAKDQPARIQKFIDLCGVKRGGKDFEVVEEGEEPNHGDRGGPVYAVLVAVENAYGDREELKAPCEDASRLADVLKRVFGSRLRLCEVLRSQNGDRLSGTGVLKALYQQAVSEATKTPGAQVLFYFAGHAEIRDGMGYLVMADGCLDLPMAQVFLAHQQAGVPMVAILDACRSGAVLSNTFQRHYKNPMAMPRLTVLCASYDNTPAMELGDKGLFTSCLIDVLKECDTTAMDADAVGRAVDRRMAEELVRLKVEGIVKEGCEQVPCMQSFPLGSSDEVRRRLCFCFGPRQE